MSLDINVGRGMIVAGIIMLVACFFFTYNLLSELSIHKEGTGIEAIISISTDLITAVTPLIFVGVLVWISSILLDKGIKLVSELKKASKEEGS